MLILLQKYEFSINEISQIFKGLNPAGSAGQDEENNIFFKFFPSDIKQNNYYHLSKC